MKTIILKWYGPYNRDEVYQLGNFGNGVYLFTGKKSYQRASEIQYCGITEDSYHNRLKQHHKLDRIKKDLKFIL